MAKTLSQFLTIFFLFFTLTLGVFQFVWVAPTARERDVTIGRGVPVYKIAQLLSDRQIISSALLFRAVVRFKKADGALQAGVYRFSPHISLAAVIDALKRGGRPLAAMLRIPEGSSSKEIARVLEERMRIPEAEFLSLVRQPNAELRADFPWLPDAINRAGLEGYLFGDTYELLEESRAQEVVQKMLRTFSKKALPVLLKIPKGYPLNLHETLTLASIVEREVATWEDRRIVTDIFLRRLRYGMALQADSTVNYATGKNVSRASFTDLETPSAYNTYKVRGLPPGPISNPTVLTLWAVIQPIANPYWYFLTDPEGHVYYSQTFAEHTQKKAAIYGR